MRTRVRLGLTAVRGYWPSRAAFVREACLEKIGKHKAELEGAFIFKKKVIEAEGRNG